MHNSHDSRPSGSGRIQSDTGHVLGPYEVLRGLGRGSFGEVYLARKDGTSDLVAVKVVSAKSLDAEGVARFRLEAEVGRKLRHPGIVRVLSVGQTLRHYYYAMEYCPGPTLEAVLAKGALGVDQSVRIVTELAEAIGHAHELGVVHRDLKPANVILVDGHPRILDFGLARDRSLLRSLTRSGDVIGTPICMAPEQLQGRRDLGPACDIYAVGVILYQALTGRLPHTQKTFAKLAKSVVEDPPPPPRSIDPSIPEHLGRVCLRALAKDPRDRWPTAEALANALHDTSIPTTARRVSRKLVWGSTALVSILLGGVGLGVAIGHLGSDPVPLTIASPSPSPSSTLQPEPPPSPSRDWRDALAEAEAASRERAPADEVLALFEEAEGLAPPEALDDAALARAWFRYRRGDHLTALREADAIAQGARGSLRPEAEFLRVQVMIAERKIPAAQAQLERLALDAPPPLSTLVRGQLELTRIMTGSGFRGRPTIEELLRRIANAKALAREAHEAGAGPLALQLPAILDIIASSLPQGAAPWEEIVAGIRKAIRASPDDLHPYNQLAIAGYSFGVRSFDARTRREYFEASLEGTGAVVALEAEPSTQHLMQHAHVQFLLGSHAEARETFSRTEQTVRGGADPECRIWIAACDARLGRTTDAEAALLAVESDRPQEVARLLQARRGRIDMDAVVDWAQGVLTR